MKTKAYLKEFNLSLLHEELAELEGFTTEEDLGTEAPVPGELTKIAHFIVKQIPDGISLSIEENLDFPDEIINNHDKTKKSQSEKDKEEKDAKKQSVLLKLGITEEELRDLLDLN